jgi:hypothetical protein
MSTNTKHFVAKMREPLKDASFSTSADDAPVAVGLGVLDGDGLAADQRGAIAFAGLAEGLAGFRCVNTIEAHLVLRIVGSERGDCVTVDDREDATSEFCGVEGKIKRSSANR